MIHGGVVRGAGRFAAFEHSAAGASGATRSVDLRRRFGGVVGQNQPIRQIASGMHPQTRAHSWKIEPMNRAVVATEVHRGHRLGSAEVWRRSGSPSTGVVKSTSRRSAASPSNTGGSPSTHRASRAETTGGRAKL